MVKIIPAEHHYVNSCICKDADISIPPFPLTLVRLLYTVLELNG